MPTGIFKRKSIIRKGGRYHFLKAIKFSYKNEKSQQFWLFKCKCGKEIVINVASVKNGNTKSCGCFLKKVAKKQQLKNCSTHRKTGTVEYRAWQKMKERCYNKKNISYKYYNDGKRKIIVCDRWINSFKNFLEDMGKRPKGRSLDRIDNNGNYEPSNCRWATASQQANNQRKKRTIF